MKVNEHHAGMPATYLFAEVSRLVGEYKSMHPDADILSLGIGDVTRPLTPSVVDALHQAVDEMGIQEGFKGYGPEQGYGFLREAIAKHYYGDRGIPVHPDEIFISDGSKSDIGNFQELFADDAHIAIPDPVYPVYVDSNAMAGRAGVWNGAIWDKLEYLPCTEENDFAPPLPRSAVDVVYLCSPNNPMGTALSRKQLADWVAFAQRNDAVILYDAAYESYIRDPEIPRSIYEIDGAKEVAVEFHSFSKNAGFTGLRCGYATVPVEVRGFASGGTGGGKRVSLHDLWFRRQCTKYNGCPYIVQKAAAATLTPRGQRETEKLVEGYAQTAATIREKLLGSGMKVFGGKHAPYIWAGTPGGMTSWDFFHLLLNQAEVICTPGVGFGPSGEGYVRFTAFGNPERSREAVRRIQAVL